MAPSNLTKADMVKLLTEAGVAFDPESTLVQLRPLYDETVARLAQISMNLGNTDENDDTDALGALSLERQQQQQQQQQQQPLQSEVQLTTDDNTQQHNIHLIQQQTPLSTDANTQQQQQSGFNAMSTNLQRNNWYDLVQNHHMQNQAGPFLTQQPQINACNLQTTAELDQVADIDKQIELLKKKRELVALQRELQMLEYRRFDFAAFESMVSKFTGDDAYDIDKWLDDLNDAFAVFKCNDRDKLVAARRLLDKTAKMFVRTIKVNTFEDLKEQLITEFRHHYSAHEVYQQLKERKLQANESIKFYVSVMVEIANRARIPESDLVDIIVDGLCDKSAYAVMLYGANTVAELKEKLKRYEKLRRANTVPMTRGPITKQIANRTAATVTTENKQSQKSEANASAVDLSTVRCYNCFQYGHYQSKCTAPKRPPNSCFICSEVGHDRHSCPKRVKQPATVTAAAPVGATNNQEEDWDMPQDEAEVRRLAKILSTKNIVSVAFYKLSKCTDLISRLALFDSGSPTSIIARSLVPFEMKGEPVTTNLRGIGNKRLSTYGYVKCKIVYKNRTYIHNFFVLPDEEAVIPFLIGRDLLHKMNIHLCQISENRYSKNEILKLNVDKSKNILNKTVESALESFDLLKSPVAIGKENPTTDAIKSETVESKVKYGSRKWMKDMKKDLERMKRELSLGETQLDEIVGFIEITDEKDFADFDEMILLVCAIDTEVDKNKYKINEKLGETEVNQFKSIINENYVNKIGENRLDSYSMKITLTDDKPVHSSPRRLSYKEKKEVQSTIDDLMHKGIIRESNSPYASPIVLVRKKNGELRMCVDYRALNKITVKDRFPLPVIEDCLEYLSGKKYFSTLDLKSGFHQVPMSNESVPLTSFVTPMGQFEYVYMPFGLANAPPVFQRIINQILQKLIKERKIVVFLDDINIATKTLEEHKEVLTEVLSTLALAGLILNFDKCKFAFEEIEYLGYVVNAMGIRPNEVHLCAIRDFPVPRSVKEAQCCYGLFSYFRRFVKDFSRIARPISALIKKDAKFIWSKECTEAFEFLKKQLTEAPILCIFDPNRETELHTDASSKGFGAGIMQKQDDKRFHPVAWFSKCTTPAESKYHSFELETLAIVYALKRFRMFLEGIPFTIVTDCNSLALTLNKKLINPRIARWALDLENFDYKIKHRKGEQMAHVDALSRVLPVGALDGSDIDLNIQISQSRDKVINELKSKLENKEINGYSLENGLVFRLDKNQRRQLYVPAEWENNVMRLVHEKYGHLGVEKCAMQIQKNYWFPYMREKLNTFIRNCLKCIYYSASQLDRRNLHSIDRVPEPFHTLHIDHFGPLPSLKSKRKHVLIIVDPFTKFTKLYAVNSTSTKESWCALLKYFEAYSRPVIIYTDKGTCFTSVEFANNMKNANIRHIQASVASPQSNGQVERANRVLKAVAAKLTEPVEHSDWVQQLSKVEFALNNTVHCTTKQTPSKMLFGTEQRGEVIDELTEYLREYYGEKPVNINEIRNEAHENIKQSQLNNQKYFKQKHKPAREFQVGDLVVIKHVDSTVGKNKKFNIKYRGPYCVRKCIGNDRYHITDVENCQLTQMPYDNIIDSSRMRLWLEHKDNLTVVDFEGNTDDSYVDYKLQEDEELIKNNVYTDEEFVNNDY